MKKKIKVEQLKPGIFIDDFNCSWLDHPFFTDSIKVNNEETIEKIIDTGIREVYIDTDKGLDVDDAPTKEEVKQEIQTEFVFEFLDPKPMLFQMLAGEGPKFLFADGANEVVFRHRDLTLHRGLPCSFLILLCYSPAVVPTP